MYICILYALENLKRCGFRSWGFREPPGIWEIGDFMSGGRRSTAWGLSLGFRGLGFRGLGFRV